jgi:hypothetical protein
MANVIDAAFFSLQRFFESYGWYVVFSCVAMYVARPYVAAWARRRSLQQANDPQRVKVLDAERRRVRVHQQLDVMKAHREQTGSGAYT